jgi:hypothetical protein
MAYEFTSLSIIGYGEKPVPNLYMRQAEPASILCLMLPGLNYTCDMPLLYYPANLLLQRGADVLQVKADYTGAAFQAATGEERIRWLSGDAAATLHAGLARRSYTQVVLVGKSIGTLSLAALIANQVAPGSLFENVVFLWLTPLLHQPALVAAALACKSPALFGVGTGDRTYDPEALARIRQATGAEALFVEGGDHRLEIDGDLYRSLEAMGSLLRGIAAFLDRHQP